MSDDSEKPVAPQGRAEALRGWSQVEKATKALFYTLRNKENNPEKIKLLINQGASFELLQLMQTERKECEYLRWAGAIVQCGDLDVVACIIGSGQDEWVREDLVNILGNPNTTLPMIKVILDGIQLSKSDELNVIRDCVRANQAANLNYFISLGFSMRHPDYEYGIGTILGGVEVFQVLVDNRFAFSWDDVIKSTIIKTDPNCNKILDAMLAHGIRPKIPHETNQVWESLFTNKYSSQWDWSIRRERVIESATLLLKHGIYPKEIESGPVILFVLLEAGMETQDALKLVVPYKNQGDPSLQHSTIEHLDPRYKERNEGIATQASELLLALHSKGIDLEYLYERFLPENGWGDGWACAFWLAGTNQSCFTKKYINSLEEYGDKIFHATRENAILQKKTQIATTRQRLVRL